MYRYIDRYIHTYIHTYIHRQIQRQIWRQIDGWMNKKVIPETERNWSAGWLIDGQIGGKTHMQKKKCQREREIKVQVQKSRDRYQ